MTLNTNIKTTTHYNLDCANGLWEICDCGAHGAWEDKRVLNLTTMQEKLSIECSECGLDYADFLEDNMTDEEIDEAQEDNN
jgi:hypothetical protein|tara:strand:+ start:2266 stop:2508 length:243 start_codon:yes stop_codon:yes gene_type:complete